MPPPEMRVAASSEPNGSDETVKSLHATTAVALPTSSSAVTQMRCAPSAGEIEKPKPCLIPTNGCDAATSGRSRFAEPPAYIRPSMNTPTGVGRGESGSRAHPVTSTPSGVRVRPSSAPTGS